MSPLGKRMVVELFTATSRITGEITTHHIHVRDELNDARLSILVFDDVQVAALNDLRAPRIISTEAWVEKDEVLLALPFKIKGTTSVLAQRVIQSRLGKNEHQVLLDIPPFRIVGNLYFAGKMRIQNALRRDRTPFSSLSNAQVSFLHDPSISFVTDEVVFNCARVKMLCSEFAMDG